MTNTGDVLPDRDRRLHRVLVEGLLRTGEIPNRDELVAATGISAIDLSRHLSALAKADYLNLDRDGRVACLYPFSPSPTPHVVRFDGVRRYAMCSIDALGVAAMLNRAVEIESVCGVCLASIRLSMSPGKVAAAKPSQAVVLARRSGNEPACETCCPSTLFACGPEYGAELTARLPETVVVPLDEALRHAESIFGDLLGDALPARRRRSRLAGSPLQT